MTWLLLVRHGETEWNQARRLQGQQDIPLSTQGVQQAAALAEMVAAFAPDRVVASDLARTQQTATALGYPESESATRWREANLGSWTGKAIETLKQTDPKTYTAWRNGTFTPEGAESFDILRARVLEATKALEGSGKTVLVVTHGGVIRALCRDLLCLPPQQVVPVSPGSLTVLLLPHGAQNLSNAKLHTFNWRPHGALLDAPE